MKDLIKKILKEETQDEFILEIPNLSFIPNADLTSPKGMTDAWNELLRLLNGKPFIFDDDLDLTDTHITSLGNLKSVNGYLDLSVCKNLTSLGNLQSVNGLLELSGCKNLTSLGNLQSVDGHLGLYGCNQLTSLGNLQTVNRDLTLRFTNITSLGNLQSVGGDLGSSYTEITSLGNLKSVGGDLYLRNTPISKKYSEEEIRRMVDVKSEIILQ